MKIIIRKAEITDIKILAKLDKDLLPATAWNEQEYFKVLSYNHYVFFIAEIVNNANSIENALNNIEESRTHILEKNVYGFCGFMLTDNTAELLNIAVKQDYRRLGIAQDLLSKGIEYIKNCNVSEIFLEVNEHNSSAMFFYIKNGFKKINIRKRYYGEDSAIIMCKTV